MNPMRSIFLTTYMVMTVLCKILYAESTALQDYENISNHLTIHVALDGSQPYSSIQDAIDSIPWKDTRWIVIMIHSGNYQEKIRIHKSRIILKGEDREKTRIEYPQLRTDWEKNPDKLIYAKTGWPRLRRYALFRSSYQKRKDWKDF